MTHTEKDGLARLMVGATWSLSRLSEGVPILYYFDKELITVKGDFDSTRNGDHVLVFELDINRLELHKITWDKENEQEGGVAPSSWEEWELDRVKLDTL